MGDFEEGVSWFVVYGRVWNGCGSYVGSIDGGMYGMHGLAIENSGVIRLGSKF